MNKLNALDWLALVLVIVGGINWGAVGAFDVDLVQAIFGDMATVSRVVYILVGLSAVYLAAMSMKLGKQ